ncbi:retrovirus-related pol polyprotein from transposon TNT 1-94 [Tanacetum coccineum]|uniref:Retrovirus-related pol polyprotein from transposon TNT 1-94 n=1 Tax=Tanacetum coccineum TaxID=301880 RepID=A0ABQ4ZJ32_9ASTR
MIYQDDQNDVECDNERAALANLKLDVDENKKIQKQLKKANATLSQELTECKSILAETSKTLGESNSIRDNMEILVKKCLMPLALKTQNDSLAFIHELKQEMHADLKYVESLEDELDELESDKAEFLNMMICLLQRMVLYNSSYSLLTLDAPTYDGNICFKETYPMIKQELLRQRSQSQSFLSLVNSVMADLEVAFRNLRFVKIFRERLTIRLQSVVLSKKDIVDCGLPKTKVQRSFEFTSHGLMRSIAGSSIMGKKYILNFVSKDETTLNVGLLARVLSASKLPLFFWAEAIVTACYTQNRSRSSSRPHERTGNNHIINDRKPSIKHLHIFGCTCYLTRDGENLDKMKEKGDTCILVGYSTKSKGYRVYNKRTRLIVESIHLRFDEIKEMSMTSVHNSSGLAPPRQMTSDHNSSELGIHDHSNELSRSKLVPKVVPPADKTATSRQELELLFHHHITMLRSTCKYFL